MERIKGSIVLRNDLQFFEQQVINSIVIELIRIGREVNMEELAYVPFSDEVERYIESIWLDDEHRPIIGCTFNDMERGALIDFLHREEISHNQLINLLDLLKEIIGLNGVVL